MAKNFTTWTVLPHEPIEKLADNLWRVVGTMPDGRVKRQMVAARMRDGRVVVHNAIALSDDEMRALEAWGKPSVLYVPNGYHRQDAAIWKQRYPGITVAAPEGSRKRVSKAVPVEAVSRETPHDDTVTIHDLDGLPSEAVMEVRSGDRATLVFCDAVLNMPKTGGPVGLALAPTGRISVPRLVRWIAVKDKRALAAHLERLAATPGLERLLFGHGKPITEDPAGALRRVVAQLRE